MARRSLHLCCPHASAGAALADIRLARQQQLVPSQHEVVSSVVQQVSSVQHALAVEFVTAVASAGAQQLPPQHEVVFSIKVMVSVGMMPSFHSRVVCQPGYHSIDVCRY